MEQVFFNLMKNALEAMKDGGELAIEIVSDDAFVNISFHDSGVGMSDKALARLFEPYRTTKKKGTGLGLMISRRIVTAHGGEIAVSSEEGHGTKFTVRLPRLKKRVRELV
jgi:signal transduction histidine kinase